ncbi:hypothetical protein [Burkholderia sp. GbtcB21]|uniref:hypothetical protein n=1 Tax=Burkholderia sp. GbtcB21 TaxID=2824766 RepID=UPI001C30F680|nr:hypothetical protein [Burkholderia sp. GbtcB21]
MAKALAESSYCGNVNRFSADVGVSAPTVAAWVGAASIKPAQDIKATHLMEACRLLNVRPEWILYESGQMRPGGDIGNPDEKIPDANVLQEINQLIIKLQNLHTEIEATLAFIAGLPSLSPFKEHSYGRNVSPSHDLRKSTKRLPNLWPEVTDHAEHRTKPRSNKT